MAGLSSRGFSTLLVHAGEMPDPVTGAHGVPLYGNATYAFRSFDQVREYQAGRLPHYLYARYGNPTVRCFELKIAALEGAEAAVAGANGMAVLWATLAEVARDGGHIIASDDLYGVTGEVLNLDLPAQGSSVSRVNTSELDAVEAAITPATRAILVETLSNPRLRVADLPALARIAHSHGVLLIVDNTFLSPALLRPLEHGADLVIHSATKYLSGTGQTLGGVVAGPRALIGRIAARLGRQGGTMPAFAGWLLLAGIKSLALRMERHSASASHLAAMLAQHPAVAEVLHPSLPTHPGADVARRLCGDRFGGMLSFRLRGGEAAMRAFVDSLRVCTIAVSLGEAATLIWPYVEDGLLRLSVGLEDVTDLEEDLRTGLGAAMSQAS
jgi:cystathionine beta-lyase/cystathionine gamma-synthase